MTDDERNDYMTIVWCMFAGLFGIVVGLVLGVALWR
jgi:hypothetical protein